MNSMKLLGSAAALMMLAGGAQAAAIRTLPDLVTVTVYEITTFTTPVVFTPDGAQITTRLPGALTALNNDFTFFPEEYYDVFYSDANGVFNIDGEYLTIEGVWRPGDFVTPNGGMNINEVELNFGTSLDFGDFVASFVTGSICDTTVGVNCIIGSEQLAADGDLNTFPRLGQTSQTNLEERFRLTIGFNGVSGVIPEPGIWAMMIVGFAATGAALRAGARRRLRPAYGSRRSAWCRAAASARPA